MIDLCGLNILNTRPKDQAERLNQNILAAHGCPRTCPVLTIVPVANKWIEDLAPFNKLDQLIFTSRYAVDAVALKLRPTDFAPQTIITAIGESTATALRDWGMRVDFTPNQSDSEHLLAMPHLRSPTNQCVVLFKGQGGRTLIPETLKNRGAAVLEMAVYQRIVSPDLHENWSEIWRDGKVDIILLTSEEAITALSAGGMLAQCQQIPCLVLSNRLAESARFYGMKTVFVCRPESIIQALYDVTHEQGHHYERTN